MQDKAKEMKRQKVATDKEWKAKEGEDKANEAAVENHKPAKNGKADEPRGEAKPSSSRKNELSREITNDDFIEIEFTGREKESNGIFDTTKHEGHDHAVIVCVGQRYLIAGLDSSFLGRKPGDKYRVYIKPEDAFGKKDAKLIQLISTAKFTAQDIRPGPGLRVNIDGMAGTVMTVTGGRTVVDFNHPLAGREVFYDVEIKRIVEEPTEKLKALLNIRLGIEPEASVSEGIAEVKLPAELPAEIQKILSEEIISKISGIKIINFSVVKKDKNLNTS